MAKQKCSEVYISADIPQIMKNSSNFYNISEVKEFKPDILLNFEIQYGG